MIESRRKTVRCDIEEFSHIGEGATPSGEGTEE